MCTKNVGTSIRRDHGPHYENFCCPKRTSNQWKVGSYPIGSPSSLSSSSSPFCWWVKLFPHIFVFRLFLSRSNYVHIGQNNNNEFSTYNNQIMTYVHGLVWFVQTKKFISHRTCRRRLRIRNLSSAVSDESENTRKLFTKNCVQW